VSYHQIQPEDPARAAECLLAEYDATDVDECIRLLARVTVQPVFTLKSVQDPGEPMKVAVPDYQDPDRWWL
jgi:hypothetical protein